MIVRILGPMEVAGTSGLGGPKQRALLAALVLHADEVVPRDELLEAVWGNAHPPTAAHALQVYVSALRRALAKAPATIESRAGGYRLSLDRSMVDAHVFAGLADDGARALAAGDPALAASRFEEALGLWRGPALADFRYEAFAQAEIARLEEMRLAVLEERADALLALGRHVELVPELDQLVKAEPLRERLRARLMLGLA